MNTGEKETRKRKKVGEGKKTENMFLAEQYRDILLSTPRIQNDNGVLVKNISVAGFEIKDKTSLPSALGMNFNEGNDTKAICARRYTRQL